MSLIDQASTMLSPAGDIVIEVAQYLFKNILTNIDAINSSIRLGGIEVFGAIVPMALIILQLALILFELQLISMVLTLLNEVRFVWNKPKPYSAVRDGGKRILIIGDSTAYGTGAARPEDSIAGRLGHDFPRTTILNMAINGSLTRDAIDQLKKTGDDNFDFIFIFTGANDIWRFTGLTKLERDLNVLLNEAAKKSGKNIALLFYSNMGNAPIFPKPVRALLGRRTKAVHDIFSRVATEHRIPLIELYTGKRAHDYDSNPFIEDPKKYYARDQMHPNSEGYRLWYNRMWVEMKAHGLYFEDRS